jgi:cytochrome b
MRLEMSTADNTVKVWDPVVRIGHWTLVIAFFTAYFTEDDFLITHVWAGYILGFVVCFRLIWGFVGTSNARFTSFVRSPSTTIKYLADLARKRSRRYIGHNPAGGAMILALLILLAGTVFSGVMVYGLEDGAGPLAGFLTKNAEQEELWEEIHEVIANLTLLMVGVHVAGMLFSAYAHRENLIKAMITGRKKVSND